MGVLGCGMGNIEGVLPDADFDEKQKVL